MSNQEKVQQKAKKIKLMVFDIDGVMTDGKLFFSAEGDSLKAFNATDGLGIKMLLQFDINVAIITGRKSDIVTQRAKELGIEIVFQGQKFKKQALEQCQQQLNLQTNEIGYMGDDINDIPVMQVVELAVAPANAFDDVKHHADYICQRSGGDGAVREICNLILKAQNKWQQVLKSHE